ncbi:MAG: transporter substrate-binding domain-containing protein [Deltaproteobacteria bacterium]|nr:transporter substrate-binding domain-containing protein [Deltaproteobacteria bacterium]
MKKRFSLIFITIFITFLSSNLFSQSLPGFLIMTENWKPYNFQEDGVIKGVSTDMLVLMLKKIGSQQGRKDIKLYPWSRSYKLVQEKKNAVLYTTTRTPEREKMFKWVGPIFDMTFYIYALKSKKIKIKSYDDLKKYKIGVIREDVTEQLLVKKAGFALKDL